METSSHCQSMIFCGLPCSHAKAPWTGLSAASAVTREKAELCETSAMAIAFRLAGARKRGFPQCGERREESGGNARRLRVYGVFRNTVVFLHRARSPLPVGRVDFSVPASVYTISENAIVAGENHSCGYSTECRKSPHAGAVGPAAERERAARIFTSSSKANCPRPISSMVPTRLRTM